MGWNSVGQTQKDSKGSSSQLIKIEDKKRVRLLLPETGPVSHWSYSVSTPADGYRTWISPAKEEDFFGANRSIFRLRPVHAGLAYDYDEKEIKILEAGNQIWEGIKLLVDAGKDVNARDIMIMKKGSGRNTEYAVTDCDPTPAPAGIDSLERPDMDARYQAPTFESVIEDLRALGFTNPTEIFETTPLAYEVATQTKVPFGKFKDKTLKDVVSLDSTYITFLATKIDREDIKECARVVSNTIMGTQYELKGVTPTMEQVSFVAPTEGGEAPQEPNTPPTPPKAKEDTKKDTKDISPKASDGRDGTIAEINKAFETQEQYKDFMKIIDAMKKASAPHGKTSITDFTDEELAKLKEIVLG